MNRIDILFVSMASGYSSKAAGRRISSFQQEFEKRGLSWMELVPVSPSGACAASHAAPSWIAKMVSNHRGLATRTIGEWAFLAWTMLQLLRIRPTRMLVSIPFVPIAALCLLPRRIIGVRSLVLDVRDLTWEYARNSTSTPLAAPLVAAYRALVFTAARRVDLVSTATDAQAAELAKSCTAAPIEVIQNAISESLVRDLSNIPPTLDDDRPITFLYAGTLGYAQDPAQLLEIVRLRPRIQLTFAGSGPLTEEVTEASEQMSQVRILGQVPFENLIDAYTEADVLIACLRHSAEFASAVPSKLYEYAATGRVVAYVGPGVAQDLARSLSGLSSERVTSEFLDAVCDAALTARRAGRGPHAGQAIPTREDAAARFATQLLR